MFELLNFKVPKLLVQQGTFVRAGTVINNENWCKNTIIVDRTLYHLTADKGNLETVNLTTAVPHTSTARTKLTVANKHDRPTHYNGKLFFTNGNILNISNLTWSRAGGFAFNNSQVPFFLNNQVFVHMSGIGFLRMTFTNSSNTFTLGASVIGSPTSSVGSRAAEVYDNKLYFVSGGSFWSFDPVSDEFKNITDLYGLSYYPHELLFNNNEIFSLGDGSFIFISISSDISRAGMDKIYHVRENRKPKQISTSKFRAYQSEYAWDSQTKRLYQVGGHQKTSGNAYDEHTKEINYIQFS